MVVVCTLPDLTLSVASSYSIRPGFIGSHVVDQALKAGLRVRAAVRDANKVRTIKEFFEKSYPGQIEYIVVPDMVNEDAYVEAVKGMPMLQP